MINTLTLNPAIDRLIFLTDLKKNCTNRIQKTQSVIGGKGTHVSINLGILGAENRAFGICFGNTGKEIMEVLRKSRVEESFLWEGGNESRTNYLLIEDTNDCTIVADKGVTLSSGHLSSLIEQMRQQIRQGEYLVLSGDASNCSNPMIYNDILDALSGKQLKVFLDTSGDSLEKCVKTSPFLIKPNLDELSSLCRRELKSDEEIVEALFSLDKYNISVIAVSLGGRGSLVKYGTQIYKVTPPRVNVKNTIGCGDCYLSGLVYGFQQNKPIEETIRIATAVSAATAESELSVGFDPGRAKALLEKVQIIKLK